MTRNIAELTQDPRNARKHNPRNVGMVAVALREVGAARSIVIDENGVILAGNATIEAAAEAGIENLQIIDVDGETIVAVRRSGLTEEQKTRLALYDNRTAELADWDADVLAAMDDAELLDGMFYDYEIAEVTGAKPDEFNPEDEWVGMPEFENADLTAKYKVVVNFARDEDVAEFERLVGQKIPAHPRSIWFPRTERLNATGGYKSDES